MVKERRQGLWGKKGAPVGLRSACLLVKEKIILFFPEISMDIITSGVLGKVL